MSEVTVRWQVLSLRGHTGIVCSVAVSQDGTRIVRGSGDHLVKIWDAATGALVSSFWYCVECGEVVGLFTAVVLSWFCIGSRLR